MNSQFNDKHLLWWVLKAVDAYDGGLESLLSETTWKLIDAPDWVLPAMREKYEIFNTR